MHVYVEVMKYLHKNTGNSNHWICTSRLSGYIVQVMDSLGLFMALNLCTVLQIAKIYSVPKSQSVLHIHKIPVQQQQGTLDCGLFAIAFAVEVCFGRNPQCASFNQKIMREHLYTCLTQGVLTSFPKISDSEALPRPSPVVHKIHLYCVCHMPEEYDESMISCDICQEWFHMTCVRVDATKPPQQWTCQYCCRL